MESEIRNIRSMRYVIDIFTVILNDTPISIDPKFISSMNIEKDFDNDNLPIFELSFNCNDEIYYDIINNKENVRFKLRIMKYEYDYSEKIRSKKLYVNEVFVAFIDEEAMDIARSMKKQINDEMQYTANKSLTLYLFKEVDLLATKVYSNFIIKNNTMLNTLAYILSSSGVKSVLISPLKNIKKYDEMIIPPMTLIPTIRYLENVYGGLYTEGSVIFMDLDRMYILDKKYNNTAYSINEYKEVVLNVLEATDVLSNVSGFEKNDDMKLYNINVPIGSIQKANTTIANEHINGHNAIVISNNEVVRIEPNVRSVTGKVYKLLLNRYNNPNITNEYKSICEENDTLIQIGLDGIDIDAFTPNKLITLKFSEQLLNKTNGGKYRLTSVKTSFMKADNVFIPKSLIQINKYK